MAVALWTIGVGSGPKPPPLDEFDPNNPGTSHIVWCGFNSGRKYLL